MSKSVLSGLESQLRRNLLDRSTYSCTNNNYLDLGLFWSKKLDVKFSHLFIGHKDTH